MLIFNLFILYKDIDVSYYSNDKKILNEVTDSSPYLRISAQCEIIKDECFYQLNTLLSFTFEDNSNLITIGIRSFNGCINLDIINLSSCKKLIKISEYAFCDCLQVSEIILPQGIHVIERSAFCHCLEIKNLIIPASVNMILNLAFFNCLHLKNVTFEEGSALTELNEGVFSATSISSFQIPENVSKINGKAFDNDQLTSITVHSSNKYLIVENNIVFSKDKTVLYFFCCKPIGIYEIPAFIKILSTSCLSEAKLTSAIIPANVKRLKKWAFLFCPKLINVTFLSPIDFIGEKVFGFCYNLQFFIFPNSPMIVNIAGFCSDETPKLCLKFIDKTLFSSDSIMRITNVSFSDSIEQNLIINSNSLVMNYDQTEIYKFSGYNYDNITIPKSVKIIKENAFGNSTIKKINFEDDSQLSVIDYYAFQNCTNLITLEISSPLLSSLGFASFIDCVNLVSVKFASQFLIVMNNAFENCKKLEDVSNILSIPDFCFSDCIKLKEITILEGSKMIGIKSFKNCTSIEKITIPSTVETISDYAFSNCDNLKSIIFSPSNSLSNISINGLSWCRSLQSIRKKNVSN